MSNHRQRLLMAAAGVAVIAAGLLSVPGTGSAVVGELPSTTIDVPTTTPLDGTVADAVKTIEGITGSTVTTSTTTTTSSTTTTSTTSTTTTTVPPTTTTTAPPVEDDEDETPAALPEAPKAQPAPVITVEEIVEDYTRVEFPNYTPVFGKRSTAQIESILDSLGLPIETKARVYAPFPVAGAANYTDDWANPRFTPVFHYHEGTDIFAQRGTPVVSTTPGTITRVAHGTPVGGNVVYLTMDDGTYFYYAHLDSISPLVYEGLEVQAGQVLGTVGDSGNAVGTPPHLHFEIHPGGGSPVPPAPYLDAWLAAAEEKAQALAGTSPVGDDPARVSIPLPATPEQVFTEAAFAADPASNVTNQSLGALMLLSPVALLLWRRRRRAALALEAPETPTIETMVKVGRFRGRTVEAHRINLREHMRKLRDLQQGRS